MMPVIAVAPLKALEGTDMKRVTQFDIYYLGAVRALSSIKVGDLIVERRNELTLLWVSLNSFTNNGDNQKLLPNSVKEASYLMSCVSIIGDGASTGGIGGLWVDAKGRITEAAQQQLARSTTSFEVALKHELDELPTYVIEKIGIFDSDDLLTKADEAIADDLRPFIPAKALEDFQKAGACLAFELNTASGFHGFRAVDGMLRAYCYHFTGSLPRARDWGKCIGAVRHVYIPAIRVPNPRTVDLIQRIKDVDRNPLIHPETDLNALQARTAFDLCQSALVFMAMDIQNAP
jgi:hypothetical protein